MFEIKRSTAVWPKCTVLCLKR